MIYNLNGMRDMSINYNYFISQDEIYIFYIMFFMNEVVSKWISQSTHGI